MYRTVILFGMWALVSFECFLKPSDFQLGLLDGAWNALGQQWSNVKLRRALQKRYEKSRNPQTQLFPEVLRQIEPLLAEEGFVNYGNGLFEKNDDISGNRVCLLLHTAKTNAIPVALESCSFQGSALNNKITVATIVLSKARDDSIYQEILLKIRTIKT